MMNNTILRSLFVLTSAAIFLGTIILNLLAIIYIRSRRDKTSIAILVVNLAIADIIHASMYNNNAIFILNKNGLFFSSSF